MVPKVVVVGSANTDFIVRVPQLPLHGETVLGGEFSVAKGGKGANQAVSAARQGVDVTFIACLGTDSLGAEALAAYQAEGIHTDFIVTNPKQPSGAALILVGSDGDNMIAVAPGANAWLLPEHIQAAEDVFKNATCLLLQLEIPLQSVQAAAEIAHKNGVLVILNPAPACQIPDELFKLVDILTPNEKEAEMLLGEHEIPPGASFLPGLSEKTGVRTIVATLGSRGVRVFAGGEETHIPAFSITPVDTTACGDAFNGALASALARGENILSAANYANAAGALAATKLGAQPSLPAAKEVKQLLLSD
ncbi:MAG: ribokinase [Chloroflexi bacterium]|nr:MAG: ribokinase [Chloroflexota bacterium]